MPEWHEGDSASVSKTITAEDVELYADVSGDTNPVHVDEEYAKQTRFGNRIAHGMLTASLISAVLGTRLPGPGAIYLGQSLRFTAPVYLGDTITATATLTAYDPIKGRMTLSTVCTNQRGEQVLTGEAQLLYQKPPEVSTAAAAGTSSVISRQSSVPPVVRTTPLTPDD